MSCDVARRMYLVPLLLDGCILECGDAPLTAILRHHHRTHRTPFFRSAVSADFQIPFGVYHRYVRAQEADALDCSDVSTILQEGGEDPCMSLFDGLSAHCPRSIYHNVVGVRGTRGGECLAI